MTEFELKFQVDAAHQAAVEAAVARGRSHRAHLRARYYDTADGALASQRIVLRVRGVHLELEFEFRHWVTP